jgi:hypothetical protein
MAHLDGLVGSSGKFRHPDSFSRGKQGGTAFSGYSFGLLQKSNSPAVRIPQSQTNKPTKQQSNPPKKAKPNTTKTNSKAPTH